MGVGAEVGRGGRRGYAGGAMGACTLRQWLIPPCRWRPLGGQAQRQGRRWCCQPALPPGCRRRWPRRPVCCKAGCVQAARGDAAAGVPGGAGSYRHARRQRAVEACRRVIAKLVAAVAVLCHASRQRCWGQAGRGAGVSGLGKKHSRWGAVVGTAGSLLFRKAYRGRAAGGERLPAPVCKHGDDAAVCAALARERQLTGGGGGKKKVESERG